MTASKVSNAGKRWIIPALVCATLPLTAAHAQGPAQGPAQAPSPPARAGLSADAINRLQDGRLAMIKEALKLNDAQLKLWEPVEAQIRKAATARRQRREALTQREQGAVPSLPDRLDRASQRMGERASELKAFADAVKPFYASLSEDQKAVANVLLRGRRGHWGMRGGRWASGPAAPATAR